MGSFEENPWGSESMGSRNRGPRLTLEMQPSTMLKDPLVCQKLENQSQTICLLLCCTVSPRSFGYGNHLDMTRYALNAACTDVLRESLSTVPLYHTTFNTGECFQGPRRGDIGEGKGSLFIPIPREATSVATMMGLLPCLNSFKTQSRSFCCLSPWMAGGC